MLDFQILYQKKSKNNNYYLKNPTAIAIGLLFKATTYM